MRKPIAAVHFTLAGALGLSAFIALTTLLLGNNDSAETFFSDWFALIYVAAAAILALACVAGAFSALRKR